MKRIYLLLLFIIVIDNVMASDTMHTARPNTPYYAIKIGATTASVLIPMATLSIEHRWKKFSWLAGTGFVVPKRYNIDNSIKGTALGYTFRLEGRRHNHTPDHSGVFFGLGLFYTSFKYPHVGYFSDTQRSYLYEKSIEDEYLLVKNTIGCVLQFGGHHYIGKRIDVEMLFGVGPKLMFTSQRGRTDPNQHYYTHHPNIHAMESQLGTVWSAALQAQVSVGYILGD